MGRSGGMAEGYNGTRLKVFTQFKDFAEQKAKLNNKKRYKFVYRAPRTHSNMC